MDAPKKNVSEDLQPAPSLQSRKHSKAKISLEAFMDEEDKVVAAACKESLKNVSQLYKEVDASQGAPSLDSRKRSKATTSLQAFLDPLNWRHNENVRKTQERRNQDDEDVSIEVGAEVGTKSNHQSAKAKGIREPEEPHVFPVDEDNYDGSLAKQR
ncbi:uncharacterized protein [Triticum aestivum]|uniref:uncharacterized protein n=1 Tax=Triticum aestivum TaxID=4565 RepID=UPI001D01FD04|nr:uncharacterized protein LOC123139225 [Triticum aestivum]